MHFQNTNVDLQLLWLVIVIQKYLQVFLSASVLGTAGFLTGPLDDNLLQDPVFVLHMELKSLVGPWGAHQGLLAIPLKSEKMTTRDTNLKKQHSLI